MKYGLPVKLRDKLVARTGGVLPSWAAKLLPAPRYLQDGKEAAGRGGTQEDTEAEEEEAAQFQHRVQQLTEKLCHKDAVLPV